MMRVPRRLLVPSPALFIALVSLMFLASCSHQGRTITLICPWAAGGGTDAVSRSIAQRLEAELGQPCVVVNQTGGSGAVGHQAGAQARPDGHTILMGTFELSTMHWMGISQLTYRSYIPLLQLNADPAAILVRRDAPWNSLTELIDAMRRNPKTIKLSGTSRGGAWDLARAGMMLAAGLEMSDAIWVPTEGSNPSIMQLLGGHIDAVCCSLPEAAGQIASGELRPLAVMADERVRDYPDVPTVKESGIDWTAVGWRGLLLPQGTPEPMVEKLSRAAKKAVESEAFKSFMEDRGFGIAVRQGAAFETFLEQQDALWGRVISKIGYKRGQTGIGPWALPWILAIIIASGCIYLWIKGRRRNAIEAGGEGPEPDAINYRRMLMLQGILLAYVALMPVLGFTLSSLIVAFVLPLWLGVSWKMAAATSITLVISIYVIFAYLMKVSLPGGFLA